MADTKKSFIGWMMNIYRNSPFHNAFVGSKLAKVLYLLTVPSEKSAIREIDGVKFELDLEEVIDASLYYSGTFEPKIERLIARYLKPGMTVIDIGANIGYHTFRMASLVQPNGIVYAIEPSAKAFKKLLHNATLNQQLSNIKFIKAGLWDQDLGSQKVGFQSSYKLNGKSQVEKEEVELVRLDSLISKKGVQYVDFIKIDVDGYEGKVLRGGIETIRRFSPVLIMEMTPTEIVKNGDCPMEIIQLLNGIGYLVYDEDGQLLSDPEGKLSGLKTGFSIMLLAVSG